MKNQNMFDLLLPLNSEQSNNLKQLESTCADIQSVWLSGYFWKITNQISNAISVKINELNNNQIITIFSTFQTGNEKLLSERLYKHCNKNNQTSRLINAIDYKSKKIKDKKILILIISTQGKGDPLEEVLSLYKFIMLKNTPNLNNLYYSIFVLGDISYNLFYQVGKDFDKRFKELVGSPLLNRFDSDIEYKDDYNKWYQDLLISFNNLKKVTLKSSLLHSKKEDKFTFSKFFYTKKNSSKAVILTNKKITGCNSEKDVRHIEIDISNLNINYIPGDAIGVWYQNDTGLVKDILELLSIDIFDKIKIENNVITIFDALQNNFELTTNTKKIVKNYASFTNNQFLKNIASDDSNLQNYTIQTPLIKMINDYPSKLSSEQLISLLHPLTPRLYSISSSQAEIYDEIHITVGVVKKLISSCLHLVGASNYLSQSLKPNDIINIFIKTNNNFRLPTNQNTPIIMIASGTGIAPFRSFMQQRDNDGSQGKNWIFFGNSNFTEDFLYQTEWQQYIKKGLITNMNLAWSKDQEHKVYIQDRIRENGKEIWSWIEEGAQIYVCGNASKMAKDVEKALLDIISENSGLNFESSYEFLNNLRLNKRYKRDIY